MMLLLAAVLALNADANAATPTTNSDGASCERLSSFAVAHGTVTAARTVEAGALPDLPSLPSFCRVAVTLKPSADSDIKMELWMPAANWNGKLQAVGNGAFNGSIATTAMAAALRRGYATASTDTGHSGNTASFALGHPEKVVDFGWRAVHETAVAAKAIVAAFYTTAPTRSYFTGCSAGGRQALKEAQRFPEDFDGIVAGAPGLDWTGRAAQAVRIAQLTDKNDAARLSAADAQLLHAAVLDACDALDGVKDGVIENPTRCTFDPTALQCTATRTSGCLTAAQVRTASAIYTGRVNPKTAREITPLQRGSELGWTDRGWTASARATGRDQFRFLVFANPAWDIDAFDFDADIARAEDMDRDTINALDPNLKPFFARGGKLIQYHGWNDPQISPGNSTQYYDRVAHALGASSLAASYRLFMAPGMGHCGGGEGPSSFDMLSALERWVEQGVAPDQIVASRVVDGRTIRTRPLCPYPQVAVYKGSGSIDEAASFVCGAR
jgi:feruloyl esterase